MDHDQWPGPTSRANLEMRREPTGIYLRGTGGPFEGEMALAGYSHQGPTSSRSSWVLRPKVAVLPGLHVLGSGHPEIAADPSKLARRAGDAAAARDKYAALLPVITRLLGTDNSGTLVTWVNLATWTGEAGNAAGARDEFAALLPEAERVLGVDHPETVSIRAKLARWTGEAGDAAAARDQYAALLPEAEQVLGAHHPGTLVVRNNHAAWTGEAGNAAQARDEFAALLPEAQRVLGADHPETVVVQNNLASLEQAGFRRSGHVTERGPEPLGEVSSGDGGGAGPDLTGLPPAGRYLLGKFPDTVKPESVFSVLVSVVRSGGAPLKRFPLPAAGRLIALIIDAPGLRVLGDHRQTVLVPSDDDSEPVKFDLIGDEPGPRRISITAWDGGSYLGELSIELSVERDGAARPGRTAMSEAREGRTDGEVSLLVRYDSSQKAYRFEFIDVDYPDEVSLVYDPGPAVERLFRRLDALAEGTAGYSAEATRAYLVNEGVQLWQDVVPSPLRSQFWERQQRITQLTIVASPDVVPWELLYPKDKGRDAGFLVEQFPVTRAIYGHARQRRLWLRPARFVVPPDSPSDAKTEARALARLLGTRLSTVSELMPLLQLLSKGHFGLLHFACHNRFDPDDGSSIKLDSLFTPTFLATAAADQTLAKAAPVVFINACRSLGQAPSYNKLDGWAEKFLRAGATAFIGSLWAVTDGMANEFAQELYRSLVSGDPLGTAVRAARRAIAAEPGDPTWLAYAVYGDPQARIDATAKAR